MRSYFSLAIAAGLVLVPASRADAQVAFSFGTPAYGPIGFPYGYGYGGYGGGYGPIVGTPWGTTSYSSAYSVYTAPGTSFFQSGYYAPGLAAPAYGYGLGYPAYRSPGYGYGYGYPRGGSYGYVPTGPFMGLPRPFGGLIRVPR